MAKKQKTFTEQLNPHFGYFYTVKKTLKKGKTKFQKIELIDTEEFGRVLLLDNITQVAEKNDYQYHEPMVHPALCCHPKPENVLVIGAGDGGILREVLKYPSVKRLEHAELDEGVIDFSKKYLDSVHSDCFSDPRVRVNIVDGREYVKKHQKEFDSVIMDMTDPFGPSRMLYTKEFFRMVKRSFRNDHGVFVMHSESPISRPLAFACIQKTLRSVFRNVVPVYIYIQMYAVLWSISVCSDSVDISKIKSSTINNKLNRFGIEGLKVYNGATHASMQVPYPYIEEILANQGRIITDASPDFPDDFIQSV
jgi:spermidine synthase